MSFKITMKDRREKIVRKCSLLKVINEGRGGERKWSSFITFQFPVVLIWANGEERGKCLVVFGDGESKNKTVEEVRLRVLGLTS